MKATRLPLIFRKVMGNYVLWQWGRTRIPRKIAISPQLSNAQVRVYATITSFINEETGYARCNYAKIANRCGMAVRNVKGRIAEIVKLGLIKVTKKARNAEGAHTYCAVLITKKRFPFLFEAKGNDKSDAA